MKITNDIYIGANQKASLLDLEKPNPWNQELVIFVHGFMGFKDWGAWNLVQDYFVNQGYAFCKFNLSHNGGTIDDGFDFPDEETFGQNRYSYEIEDLNCALDYVKQKLNSIQKIHLIGHSRGGAVVLIHGKNNPNITSITTWASISSIEKRMPQGEELKKWQETNVRYIKNGRTFQELPQYYSLFEDFEENKEKFDLEKVVKDLHKPLCILHGEADSSVKIEEGKRLSQWSGVSLKKIKDADHVFMTRHPWKSNVLSKELKEVCDITLQFLISSE